jgi:hypothetical protein
VAVKRMQSVPAALAAGAGACMGRRCWQPHVAQVCNPAGHDLLTCYAISTSLQSHKGQFSTRAKGMNRCGGMQLHAADMCCTCKPDKA